MLESIIGRQIHDRYQIETELGRGGMGVVYQAQDSLLARKVAIKVVSASALSPEGRSRLLLEAQAAAQISHPNVVTIYDVGQTKSGQDGETFSFIVMELIPGKMLTAGPTEDISATAGIARQICSALAAAHEHGIIHRDLKPENILVSREGRVKLTDFGLARLQGRARITQEGAVIGTLSYMAPEIILGQEATPQTDLYSFGIVLYELLAGRSPFAGDSPTAVLSQHLHAPVVPPSTHNDRVIPAADNLVLHLLRKDPADRPRSSGYVEDLLKMWQEPELVVLDAPPSTQLSRLTRGRLVGRGSDFDRAAKVWLEASAGQNQVLMISGEPGIGKSRFAQELVTYAEFSGGLVLTGHCYLRGTLPYGPLREIIRTAVSDFPDLDLSPGIIGDLQTLAPGSVAANSELSRAEHLDLEASQYRLFDSISTLCQMLSQSRPLLLFLDDLHWADSGTLAFLRHLARRSTGWPLLILATYREVELTVKRPAWNTLRDLELEGLATRLRLERQDEQQTAALLSNLFAEEISTELAQSIYRETEGNPFFVEEVSRSLVDSGELIFEHGRWRRAGNSRLLIPENVQLAIETRLEHVPPDEIALLQTAALLGRQFEFNMLAAVSDLSEDEIIDSLEKAQESQIVREEPGMADNRLEHYFIFDHALVHSVLLSQLSTLRRQRLQLKVAGMLEAAFPGRLEQLAPVLGGYYGEAGQVDKAIHYYLLAGDSARKLFAHDDAIDAYEQALILLREGNDAGLTARSLMKLGLTYQNNHDFEQARRVYDEAFTLQKIGADVLPSASEPPPPAPHAYRDHKVEPPSLDPVISTSSDTERYVQLLFSGLVYRHPSGEIMPDIAWRWDMLDGGARYLFHLRDDVFWTDGEPVTANDFEFALKRTLSPQFGQSPALLLYDIVGAEAFNLSESTDPETIGIRATDQRTLQITLNGPVSHFIQILSQGMAFPIPSHIVNEDRSWAEPGKIVTNGAFKVKEWFHGRGSILERNGRYHGRIQGNIEEISSSFLDPGLMPARYASGELDSLNINLLAEEDRLKVMSRFPDDYNSNPSPFAEYYFVDVNRSPMDSKLLRQALAWAVDRKQLVDNATRGLYYPATGGVVPPGLIGHVPGIAHPADPAKARRLMVQAGYPGGDGLPPIEIITSTVPILMKETEELARQWREVLNIRVEVINMPSGDFRGRWLEDPPHAWMMGWTADYPDPYSFLNDASWRPIGGWRDETYEELIQQAWQCADRKKRLALYADAEQILVDEAPVVPLAYPRIHHLIQPWIQEWQIYGTFDPFFPQVLIGTH